jgi:hypothetical protein
MSIRPVPNKYSRTRATLVRYISTSIKEGCQARRWCLRLTTRLTLQKSGCSIEFERAVLEAHLLIVFEVHLDRLNVKQKTHSRSMELVISLFSPPHDSTSRLVTLFSLIFSPLAEVRFKGHKIFNRMLRPTGKLCSGRCN